MFCNVQNMSTDEGPRRAAYTIGEVAKMFAVSDSHIRRLLRDGTLQKVPYMGSSVRISPDELERVFGAIPSGAS
jgi:excisionase family DNA binding protein